jgi:hypothetical protein
MFWTYIKNLVKLVIAFLTCRYFWNYKLYPKYKNISSDKGVLMPKSIERFAIVLQGPLITNSNFTVETLRLYRDNFPNAVLILSTWHASEEVLDKLHEYGVYVKINKMPKNPGIANINLQIITSSTGILLANEMGVQFVLKTRTDQRIYHPGLDAYLFNLIKTFPLDHKYTDQMHRLVAISLNTFRYRMYGISDMFLFGHISDMVRYWNIPVDRRTDIPKELSAPDITWRQASRLRTSEVYFCTEFLKSIGRNIEFTLEDSFRVYAEHFVIIDQSALRLYWHKYTLNLDRYAGYGFFDPELSFNDWLILYQSLDTILINEDILDQKITQSN